MSELAQTDGGASYGQNPEPEALQNADQVGSDDSKVVVAGSRDLPYSDAIVRFLIEQAFDRAPFPVDAIVSGTAWGVDEQGEILGQRYNMPVAEFPAKWDATEGKPDGQVGTRKDGDKYWKLAGFDRNEAMARYGDALIAIWDGASSGTRNMIETARDHLGDSRIYVLVVESPDADADVDPGIYIGSGLDQIL